MRAIEKRGGERHRSKVGEERRKGISNGVAQSVVAGRRSVQFRSGRSAVLVSERGEAIKVRYFELVRFSGAQPPAVVSLPINI